MEANRMVALDAIFEALKGFTIAEAEEILVDAQTDLKSRVRLK